MVGGNRCESPRTPPPTGVVAMFRATWPYAGMDQTIAYELLSTVVNFVAKDADAKRALTTATLLAADSDGQRNPSRTLMDFAFDSKHEPGSSTLELALKALSSLATVEGPARYWLLRSAFVDETATTLATRRQGAPTTTANETRRARDGCARFTPPFARCVTLPRSTTVNARCCARAPGHTRSNSVSKSSPRRETPTTSTRDARRFSSCTTSRFTAARNRTTSPTRTPSIV